MNSPRVDLKTYEVGGGCTRCPLPKLMLNSRAQRLVLAAVCHANQPTKRTKCFERKKALNRNVAKRPPHTLLGLLMNK